LGAAAARAQGKTGRATTPEKSVDSANGRVYFALLLPRFAVVSAVAFAGFPFRLLCFGEIFFLFTNALQITDFGVSEGFSASVFPSLTPVPSVSDSFDRAEKSGRV
jgi:hypothetical protein